MVAELVEAVGERPELGALEIVLQLVPPRAGAEDRAALADHVERGDRLGEQRGVAIGLPATRVPSWTPSVAVASAPSAV